MPTSDERDIERLRTRAQRRAAARSGPLYRRSRTQEPIGPVPDLFLLSAIVLLIAKSVLARGLAISWSIAMPGLWLEAAIAVLLMCSVALVFRRRSHLLILALYAVFCFLLFADALYAGFFQQMLDPLMFKIAGQTGEVSDVIVGLLRPVYLLFFIDIPVLLVWAILLRRRHAVYRRNGAAMATAVALVLVIAQVGFANAVPEGTDSTSIASSWGLTSMQLASLVQMAAPHHAIAFAAARTSGSAGTTESAVAQFNSDLGEFNPNVGGQRVAPFPVGALKGKNVILIEFESLQGMFINQKLQGQYVTPNLNKFFADSYYFPNMYSETGIGNTADAEFTIATSMLAPLQQSATTAYADRVLPSMPRFADSLGYATITLHTNDAHFWYRTDLYASLGYDKYYDKSYFKDRDKMWRGSSDEVLFQDGLKAMKAQLKTGKPLYAAFVTMTSHVAYGFPMEASLRPLKLTPGLAQSYAGKYASSISYSDKAFGDFIASLKASGLYDKSIIVVCGDHMGFKKDDPDTQDEEILNKLLGRDLSYVDHQRVGFGIHIPGQRPKVVTGVRGEEDIMPTLADLLGVDLSQTAHFGRSALVDGPRLLPFRAYFPGGSYADNNIVFVAGATEAEDQAFDIFTGKQVKPPSRNDSKVAIVHKFNAISDDWLMSLPVRAGGVSRRQAPEADPGDG